MTSLYSQLPALDRFHSNRSELIAVCVRMNIPRTTSKYVNKVSGIVDGAEGSAFPDRGIGAHGHDQDASAGCDALPVFDPALFDIARVHVQAFRFLCTRCSASGLGRIVEVIQLPPPRE